MEWYKKIPKAIRFILYHTIGVPLLIIFGVPILLLNSMYEEFITAWNNFK